MPERGTGTSGAPKWGGHRPGGYADCFAEGMEAQRQTTDRLRRLAELIDEIGVAMLATADPEGCLRSRPMLTLQMDVDRALWFFTSISSAKIDSLDRHSRVNLAYARPATGHYASVSGVTQVIRDESKARELWSARLTAWFPDGVDDPDLALLKVSIEEAEYWEAPGASAWRLLALARTPEHQRIPASG